MIVLEKANFNEVEVQLHMEQYQQGNFQLRTIEYDEVMNCMVPNATLTANFPGMLTKDEVAIKEWGENSNKDVLAFLYAWDIVDHPHKFLQTEFITSIPVCKLKIPIQ